MISMTETKMSELERELRDVLPRWAHWSYAVMGLFTINWTTPTGAWMIEQSLGGRVDILGPDVSIKVPPALVVSMLRACGALDYEP